MLTQESLGIRRALSASFDETLTKLPGALKTEGFGVLTEIDVQETLQKKLGVAFRRYRILGACNPSFSHQALESTLEAGLMMPCNVIVFEDDDRRTVVLAVDPVKVMGAQANPRLQELARSLREKLVRVVDGL